MKTNTNSVTTTSSVRGDALLAMIGNTPMIPLHFAEENRILWAKCEFLNPSGSIKDRLARTIVLDAESRGLLHRESIILECTSGNTGIAFAMVGAARGYRVAIVMSERASGERRKIIQHFGAELILFADAGYKRGIEMTREMAQADPRMGNGCRDVRAVGGTGRLLCFWLWHGRNVGGLFQSVEEG